MGAPKSTTPRQLLTGALPQEPVRWSSRQPVADMRCTLLARCAHASAPCACRHGAAQSPSPAPLDSTVQHAAAAGTAARLTPQNPRGWQRPALPSSSSPPAANSRLHQAAEHARVPPRQNTAVLAALPPLPPPEQQQQQQQPSIQQPSTPWQSFLGHMAEVRLRHLQQMRARIQQVSDGTLCVFCSIIGSRQPCSALLHPAPVLPCVLPHPDQCSALPCPHLAGDCGTGAGGLGSGGHATHGGRAANAAAAANAAGRLPRAGNAAGGAATAGMEHGAAGWSGGAWAGRGPARPRHMRHSRVPEVRLLDSLGGS